MILLDREFFAIDVTKQTSKHGIPFLMPAVKTPGIKKAVINHADWMQCHGTPYKTSLMHLRSP